MSADRDPTVLTAAASLYATLTFWAGGMPGVDGRQLIRKHLVALQPEASAAQIDTATAHAISQFEALESDSARLRYAGQAAVALKTSMGSEASRKVLPALWAIAGADMHINDFERQFIMESAAYFGSEGSVASTSPDTIYSGPDGSVAENAPAKPTSQPPAAPDPARFRTAFVSAEEMFKAADAVAQHDPTPVDVPQPRAPGLVGYPLADGSERNEPPGVTPQPAVPPRFRTQFMSEEDMFKAADAAVRHDVAPPPPLVDIAQAAPPVESIEPPPLANPYPVPPPTAAPNALISGDFPGSVEPPLVVAVKQKPPSASSSEEQFGLTNAELVEHFEACVGAAEQLAAPTSTLADKVEGPAKAWADHIELLAQDRERACQTIAWPRLADASASSSKRFAAALVLVDLGQENQLWDELEHRSRRLDSTGRDAILEALEFHSTPERLGTKLARLATNEQSQGEWRRLSARLLLDPGSDRLAELLASEEPADLGLGLQLLCVHEQRARFAGVVERSMFATELEVQVPAVIAGLLLGHPAAAIICKQKVRSRGAPLDLLLLHAVTANAKDFEGLLTWAAQSDVDAHVLFSLGYSGRRGGIEVCMRGLLDSREDHVEAALAGFRASTGFAGEAHEVDDWWREHESRFEPRRRYMRGQLASASGAKETLRRADARSWDALRLELLVRSRGDLVLPRVAMPKRLTALVDSLDLSPDWFADPSS